MKESKFRCLLVLFGVSLLLAPIVMGSSARTLFLAHYDGVTDNNGLDADFATGDVNAVKAYGIIDATAKFGVGAYYNPGVNPSDPNNDVLAYSRSGNFNSHAGTVEMWIRPTLWDDGEYQGLFCIRLDNGHDIRIQKRDTAQLSITYTSDSGTWGLYKNGFFPDDGQWHHIAWTWDVGAQITEFYLNGQVVDTVKHGTIADYQGNIADTFVIGDIDPKGGAYRFKGQIDEVRISSGDRYGGLPFTPPAMPFSVNECLENVVGDLNEDCIVDFKDFAIMSFNWLEDTNI